MPLDGAPPYYLDTRGRTPYARSIPNTRLLPFATERIWLPWAAVPGPRKMGKIPIGLDGRPGSHANPEALVTAVDAAQWAYLHPQVPVWVPSRQAREVHPIAGILLNLLPGSPHAGIDLDNCRDRDSGAIQPWATDVIDATRDFLYWEVSPGLQGLRGIGNGTWQTERQNLRRADGGAIELYDGSHGARALTFTGLHLPGTAPVPAAAVAPERLAALAAQLIPPDGGATTVPALDVGPVPRFREVELAQLHLDDYTRDLILQGIPEGQDRSQALFFLATALLRLNNPPHHVACLLADERFPVSRAALDRRGKRASALAWVWKYIVTPARQREAGLESVFDGLEDAEDDDPEEETPVHIVLARLRQALREDVTTAIGNLTEGLTNEAVAYQDLEAALDDRAVKRILAPTGSGKTYTLTRLGIGALSDTLRGNAPYIVSVSTVEELHALRAAIGEAVGQEAMQRCASVEQGSDVKPLRARDGAYRYQLVLCTHGAIHRRGDDINARGRLLRLMSNTRDLELRRGWTPEPFSVYIDEGDAFCKQAEMFLPLGYRLQQNIEPITGEAKEDLVTRCPQGKCTTCKRVNHTHAAGVSHSGVPLYRLLANLRHLPHAKAVTLPWLFDALNPPESYGGYRVHTIRADQLPNNPALVEVPAADGHMLWRPDPAGIAEHLMKAPYATIRYALPLDRESGQPIDPSQWDGDEATVQWPVYPCEVPHLVSWDVDVFRDLAELAQEPPVYLSASWTPSSLNMLHLVYGPQRAAKVASPDDRKMEHVQLTVVSQLRLGQEEVNRLVSASPVLRVHSTFGAAKESARKTSTWSNDVVKPAIYSHGQVHTGEEVRPTYVDTYSRSALVRAANLGRYRLIIANADTYDALMTVPALGTDGLFEAIEAERQARLVQVFGRNLRHDREDPADPRYRHLVLIGGEDKVSRAMIDDGTWLYRRLAETARQVSFTTFRVHPDRLIPAHEEFMTAGQVRITDDTAPTTTADQLSPRQRQLTAGARATTKHETRLARLRQRLDQLAMEGVDWREASRRTNLNRVCSQEEIGVLQDRYREIADTDD